MTLAIWRSCLGYRAFANNLNSYRMRHRWYFGSLFLFGCPKFIDSPWSTRRLNSWQLLLVSVLEAEVPAHAWIVTIVECPSISDAMTFILFSIYSIRYTLVIAHIIDHQQSIKKCVQIFRLIRNSIFVQTKILFSGEIFSRNVLTHAIYVGLHLACNANEYEKFFGYKFSSCSIEYLRKTMMTWCVTSHKWWNR